MVEPIVEPIIERRRSTRWITQVSAELRTQERTIKSNVLSGTVANANEFGICLTGARQTFDMFSASLERGSVVALQLHNGPERSQLISVDARVAWITDTKDQRPSRWEIGLELLPHKENRGSLAAILPLLRPSVNGDVEQNYRRGEDQLIQSNPTVDEEMLRDTHRSLERCPHHRTKDYEPSFVTLRRGWLSERTGVPLNHLASYSIGENDVRGNIENFVGVAQVPLGLVGPVEVRGTYARGTFYVPFATTEGALVSTYQRGAIALTKSGGAKTLLLKDENHLDPVLIFESVTQVQDFLIWLSANFAKIKVVADQTSTHSKLLSITPHVFGRRVVLDCAYDTADAMGANMVNVSTERACQYIMQQQPATQYLLRSNFGSEKKASSTHFSSTYGKQVIAETVLPRKVVDRYLHSTPEKISKAWHSWAIASLGSGTVGMNAHFANGLAAIFIACGQDAAHVANGCVGLIMFELTASGDLYAAVKLASLLVGTVGGGTALGTQRECLEILGCYGNGRTKKFAEIIAATVLAGEIGICAGITSEEFLDPHKRARVHTVAKAYEQ